MKPLKQKFNIVFQPKDRRYKKDGNRCKKFMISANRLADYIGRTNADKVTFMLKNSLDEKWQMQFRKYGKLWIYGK
jgi:hypothetical protein